MITIVPSAASWKLQRGFKSGEQCLLHDPLMDLAAATFWLRAVHASPPHPTLTESSHMHFFNASQSKRNIKKAVACMKENTCYSEWRDGFRSQRGFQLSDGLGYVWASGISVMACKIVFFFNRHSRNRSHLFQQLYCLAKLEVHAALLTPEILKGRKKSIMQK